MLSVDNYSSKPFSKVVLLDPTNDIRAAGTAIDLTDTSSLLITCNWCIVQAGVTNADGYFMVEPMNGKYSDVGSSTSGVGATTVFSGSGTGGIASVCSQPAVFRVTRWDSFQQVVIKNCLDVPGGAATYFTISYGWAEPTNTLEGQGVATPHKGV